MDLKRSLIGAASQGETQQCESSELSAWQQEIKKLWLELWTLIERNYSDLIYYWKYKGIGKSQPLVQNTV